MFESIGSFFKKIMKPEQKELLVEATSKDAAKERLHIVLMQDRANVSADFLELMKQEIIDVIKKYIVVDEEQIDVRLTNQENEDGTTGAPALYANIPILNIRNDIKGEVLNVEEVEEAIGIKHEKTENLEQVDEENDELDDDVTFDDLLKAAEEEEKQKREEKAEIENPVETVVTENIINTEDSKQQLENIEDNLENNKKEVEEISEKNEEQEIKIEEKSEELEEQIEKKEEQTENENEKTEEQVEDENKTTEEKPKTTKTSSKKKTTSSKGKSKKKTTSKTNKK